VSQSWSLDVKLTKVKYFSLIKLKVSQNAVGTDKPSNLKSLSESKLVFAFSSVDINLDVKLTKVKYLSLVNLKVSQNAVGTDKPSNLKSFSESKLVFAFSSLDVNKSLLKTKQFLNRFLK
jgi:hypothetical protein